MVRIKTIACLIALSAFAAACSEGSSDNSKSGKSPASPSEAPVGDDVSALDGLTLASFTGSAKNGKTVFAQCRTCHAIDAGVNKIGPSLNGIVGKKSGAVPGFVYSTANATIGLEWTKENLFEYLENPQRAIPGTRMIYGGLRDAQDRADIIAYLESPN